MTCMTWKFMMNDFPFAGALHHHSPENGEPQGVHLHGKPDHSPSRWSLYLSSCTVIIGYLDDLCIYHWLFVLIITAHSNRVTGTAMYYMHGDHLANDKHSHPHLDNQNECNHQHPSHIGHHSYPQWGFLILPSHPLIDVINILILELINF